jgi:hypothetical protein
MHMRAQNFTNIQGNIGIIWAKFKEDIQNHYSISLVCLQQSVYEFEAFDKHTCMI